MYIDSLTEAMSSYVYCVCRRWSG